MEKSISDCFSQKFFNHVFLFYLFCIFVVGAETDNDSDEDIHYCKKCKKVFTNIQAYLEHKIRHDNFKMTYARSHKDRRMVLPKLVQKPNNPPQQDGTSQTPMENGQEGDNTEGNEGKENQTRKRSKSTIDLDIQSLFRYYGCNDHFTK